MNNQLKKGVLDLIILGLLMREEIHGYAIVQKLDSYFKVKESSVYIILTRLEQNGYLTHRYDYNNNRKVKFYSVTDEGKRYFAELYESWNELNEVVKEIKKGVNHEL